MGLDIGLLLAGVGLLAAAYAVFRDYGRPIETMWGWYANSMVGRRTLSAKPTAWQTRDQGRLERAHRVVRIGFTAFLTLVGLVALAGLITQLSH